MTDETNAGEMPVETPVAVEAPESAPQETAPPVDTGHEPAEEKSSGFGKRIKEVIDERNYWREMAMRQQPERTEPQEPEAPTARDPGPEPKEADFDYDPEKFSAAKRAWERAVIKAEIAAEFQAEREAARQAERRSTYEKRVAEYAAKVPGFIEKTADPYLPVSPIMAEIIKDHEQGPELLNWVADNREAAKEIYRLPPHLAALELGAVAREIRAAKVAPKPVPVVSKAPPPPPTIEATEPSLKVSTLDPESDRLMNDDEWVKAERARMNRKAKRNG